MDIFDAGSVWPDWETVRKIGEGSYGAVYEIKRTYLGNEEHAAMKVIHVPKSTEDYECLVKQYGEDTATVTCSSRLKDILSEYKLMRELKDCVNVVNCDDMRIVQHSDGIGGDIFIRMELLTPLQDALKGLPEITEEKVIQIGKDMCAALVACSKYNIIHRDIKPENMFVSEGGDYKLGDFGIARTMEKTTGTATFAGTIKYMAPEILKGDKYGATVDVYSLGLVLYQLLNENRMPFVPLPPEPNTPDIEENANRRRIHGDKLPPPAHGSKKLQETVLKACAFNPKDRFKSAAEMLDALSSNPQSGPNPGRFAIPAAVAALLVVLLVSGVFKHEHVWEPATCTSPKICTKCGDTEGEPLGHTWSEATCEQPRTCSVCGATEGEALGHTWNEATCDQPRICSVCGATEGEALGHSWNEATCEQPKTCSVCGATEGEPLGHMWTEASYYSPRICRTCGVAEGISLGYPVSQCALLTESQSGDKEDIVTGTHMDVIGVTHENALRFWVKKAAGYNNVEYSVYETDGSFNLLQGTAVLAQKGDFTAAAVRFHIYGNGNLLYTSGYLSGNQQETFSIDITGITNIRIDCETDEGCDCYGIMDARLYVDAAG